MGRKSMVEEVAEIMGHQYGEAVTVQRDPITARGVWVRVDCGHSWYVSDHCHVRRHVDAMASRLAARVSERRSLLERAWRS